MIDYNWDKDNKCVDCRSLISNRAKRCYSCDRKNKFLKESEESKSKRRRIVSKSRAQEKIYTGELYSYDDTIEILQFFPITDYIGSGKQRKFIKNHKQLYFSIIHHSDEISKYYKFKNKSIISRVHLLKGRIEEILCNCRRTINWDPTQHIFLTRCIKCGTPNISLLRYQLDDGIVKGYVNYNKYLLKKSKKLKGNLSLKWFKERYEDGENKYQEHWEYNFSQRKNNNYSKISQKLFDAIIEKTNLDKNYVRYATFSEKGELRINFNKEDKKIIGESRVSMFVDFRYKNKIIEFDGSYWHKNSIIEDKLRDDILNSKGFKVYRVKEYDYNLNKEKVIKECINFLMNQN